MLVHADIHEARNRRVGKVGGLLKDTEGPRQSAALWNRRVIVVVVDDLVVVHARWGEAGQRADRLCFCMWRHRLSAVILTKNPRRGVPVERPAGPRQAVEPGVAGGIPSASEQLQVTLELTVYYGGHSVTVAAGAGGASERTVWTLGSFLEEVQQAFLGEHFHVALAAAAAEDAAVILSGPRKALLLQLPEPPQSGCFLQLTLLVVLRQNRSRETLGILSNERCTQPVNTITITCHAFHIFICKKKRKKKRMYIFPSTCNFMLVYHEKVPVKCTQVCGCHFTICEKSQKVWYKAGSVSPCVLTYTQLHVN